MSFYTKGKLFSIMISYGGQKNDHKRHEHRRDRRKISQYGSDLQMGCLGCAIAHFETLEEGVNAHGIDLDEILCALSMAATNYEHEEASKCKCGCDHHKH